MCTNIGTSDITEFAALLKSFGSCPTFVPWDVEIRPCTSGSSNECQQRASRSTELQFPPSITSISRSLFANSRALAKSFSSVVFLVRLSRQFGLTSRKAAWRSEISSRYIGDWTPGISTVSTATGRTKLQDKTTRTSRQSLGNVKLSEFSLFYSSRRLYNGHPAVSWFFTQLNWLSYYPRRVLLPNICARTFTYLFYIEKRKKKINFAIP